MRRLVIIGAGGHGKVALDIAQQMGAWNEIVFLDDHVSHGSSVLDVSIIGSVRDFSHILGDEDDWFVAIGDANKRLEIITLIQGKLVPPAVLIHPASVISHYSAIGNGTAVMAGAVVNAACEIGVGCIINTSSSIDHDCSLSDGVHISPGANLGGNVSIGKASWIGIGASIKQSISIGENVMVGAGAAVINDIPNDTVMAGVPAQRIK